MSILFHPVARWLQWLRGVDKVSDQTAPAADRPPVTVWVTNNLWEAEVVRSGLECHDIPAMIQRESASQAYPLTVGDLADCRILVPAALATEARHWIAQSHQADDRTTDTESSDSYPESPTQEF